MGEIVFMPKLSDTMTEGVVAEWLKVVGDEVSSGEVLAEIETDKATMEFESFYDGFLLHIGVEKGASAPVNSILAIIGDKDEDVAKLLAEAESSSQEEAAEPKSEQSLEPVKETTQPVVTAKTTPSPVIANTNERIYASPLAKKMATDKGIDLNSVSGTGENGRIVKRDIDHYAPYPGATSQKEIVVNSESYVDEPVSQMRKAIAKTISNSKYQSPHFYLTMDINMDKIIIARKKLNEHAETKLSFNDLIVKATASALIKHPKVNSSWMGDNIRYFDNANIGVAMAIDNGLIIPVIRGANTKSATKISQEVKSLAAQAKSKTLDMSVTEGNTFTISNLGMFNIDSFTAIIYPPSSCILAVAGIKQTPIVKDGNIVVGNMMNVTLSCDHRVVDGAIGAAFLQTLKSYLEDPYLLLM